MPLENKDLRVGKATLDGMAENHSIEDYGDSFKSAAPLWFYVLAEAQHVWTQKVRKMTHASDAERNAVPTYLGPVGGQLVAQSFIALLKNDPQSLFYADTQWQDYQHFTIEPGRDYHVPLACSPYAYSTYRGS